MARNLIGKSVMKLLQPFISDALILEINSLYWKLLNLIFEEKLIIWNDMNKIKIANLLTTVINYRNSKIYKRIRNFNGDCSRCFEFGRINI